MNKTELISEILNLYDRAEKAERKAVEAERYNTAVMPASHDPEDGTVFERYNGFIAAAGRAAILKECTRNSDWYMVVTATYNDDGKLEVTTYEDYLKRKIENVPDYFSRADFVRLFDRELREAYDAERAKAIRKAEEE